MTCQVCHTSDPSKFGASTVVCDRCLYKKQVVSLIHLQKLTIQSMLDKLMLEGKPLTTKVAAPAPADGGIFGLPVKSMDEPLTLSKLKDLHESMGVPEKLLGKSWTPVIGDFIPPSPVNCKCTLDYDEAFEQTMHRLLLQTRTGLFEQAMRRPIPSGQWYDGITDALEEHFDSTRPFLDNAVLPLEP